MRIKSFFTSCLLLATLLVSNQKLSAQDWCCPQECNPCCDSFIEPGYWSITVNAGTVPSWFLRRASDEFFYPGVLPAGTDFPILARSGRFHDRFDHPWTVGVELGYMFCCDWEAFFDFSYLQADGRCHGSDTMDALGYTYTNRFHEFRSYEYYLGTRYYLDPMFCYFTPFVGAKVGVVQRNGSRANETITFVGVDTIFPRENFYRNTTTIGGGFHFGVNCDLTCNLALSFKVEALFVGDWAGGRIDNPTPFPTIVIGNTGPILEVPITLGLRYSY